jgi:hypothetical protein
LRGHSDSTSKLRFEYDRRLTTTAVMVCGGVVSSIFGGAGYGAGALSGMFATLVAYWLVTLPFEVRPARFRSPPTALLLFCRAD